MNAVTKAEAMQARQYRLEQERQQTQVALTPNNPDVIACVGEGAPKRASLLGRICSPMALLACLTLMAIFNASVAMAQTEAPSLVAPEQKVSVVELFDYTDLANTYMTVTGKVMAIAAGVLLTIGIAWGLVYKFKTSRG